MESGKLPFEVVWKPTLITNELIRKTFNEANTDDECAGVHRMVPYILTCKVMDFRTQGAQKAVTSIYIHSTMREIPYDSIDMDFMNENQAAHGDRESGDTLSHVWVSRERSLWDTGQILWYRKRLQHGSV